MILCGWVSSAFRGPTHLFQKIYDHTGGKVAWGPPAGNELNENLILMSSCLSIVGLRKNTFPAGPDTYREYVYERDDANSDFRLVETPAASMATVE